jgi:hypothetical protein
MVHSTANTRDSATAAAHSTATAPQVGSKSGLIQNKSSAKVTTHPSALAAGSKDWPTSAIVSVATLGAVLLGVVVTAVLLYRRRRRARHPIGGAV